MISVIFWKVYLRQSLLQSLFFMYSSDLKYQYLYNDYIHLAVTMDTSNKVWQLHRKLKQENKNKTEVKN